MHTDTRLQLLQEAYRLYEAFIADFDLFCRPKCSVCCTRNVTMTTLEGALIEHHLRAANEKEWIGRMRRATEEARFQPVMTTNQLADLCARDADIPEDSPSDTSLPCPLLQDDLCSVYAVRPFGCRAMVSCVDCRISREARMPDLVLTVNNVLLQYIEALDAQRFFGNLIDILDLLANPLERQAYDRDLTLHVPSTVRVNRPIAVLMVPPEDRERIQPILQALREAEKRLLLHANA